jgi:hypothetical protein
LKNERLVEQRAVRGRESADDDFPAIRTAVHIYRLLGTKQIGAKICVVRPVRRNMTGGHRPIGRFQPWIQEQLRLRLQWKPAAARQEPNQPDYRNGFHVGGVDFESGWGQMPGG